ncbi:MAG: methylmalonyl-CoA mutase family protein, partial [Thermodesulfobacteriota bacterium]|nr:methylmalonyl-CoA mutase family protein [Thermodesulfobacteriota bacterium]
EFGARDPRSCWFRCAVETSGNSLTTQQPLNNIIRATIESLAATLGGCQSLFPSCFDEGLTLPSEIASTIALRTQQIIAYESNIVNAADPLGGSYLIESLTIRLEEEAMELIKKLDGMGGTVAIMKSGWRDKKLIEAKNKYQGQIQKGERIVVGLNDFKDEGVETEIPGGLFQIPAGVEEERIAYVKEFRKRRDNNRTKVAIESLQEKVGGKENLIPAIIEAVKAGATLQEISDAMRDSVGFKINF